MQCSAVHCSAVQCSAVQYSERQISAVNRSAVHCSAVHCSAVHCSAVQCSAVECSAQSCALHWAVADLVAAAPALCHCEGQYSTVKYSTVRYCMVQDSNVLYCTVLYSTVLNCTALHCAVLYCTVLYHLEGKGQCGGTIGAVIYLNKAKILEKDNTLKIMTWLGGELNRQPLCQCASALTTKLLRNALIKHITAPITVLYCNVLY